MDTATRTNNRSRWQRRAPWLAPVVAGACVVVGVFAPRAFAGNAHPSLPTRTPTQLIAAIDGADVQGLSGLVRSSPDLGLPKLPGSDGGNQLTTLATEGSDWQLWVGGSDTQRVALLGTGKEMDVVRNGDSVWTWDSSTQHATHYVGSSSSEPAGSPDAGAEPSPIQTAQRLVKHLSPSTALSVGQTTVVAGRSAYTLELVPRTAATLIGTVVIDVDAATGVPLGVAIYPKGSNVAGLTQAFTSVSFSVPAPSEFDFTPPPGATVSTHHVHQDPSDSGKPKQSGPSKTKVVGEGWAAVVEYAAGNKEINSLLGQGGSSAPESSSSSLLHDATNEVATGRVLQTRLLTVLFTNDGTVLAGAVPASRLEALAAALAAA